MRDHVEFRTPLSFGDIIIKIWPQTERFMVFLLERTGGIVPYSMTLDEIRSYIQKAKETE